MISIIFFEFWFETRSVFNIYDNDRIKIDPKLQLLQNYKIKNMENEKATGTIATASIWEISLSNSVKTSTTYDDYTYVKIGFCKIGNMDDLQLQSLLQNEAKKSFL